MRASIKNEIIKATEDRFVLDSDMKMLEESRKHLQEKMNHNNNVIQHEKTLNKKTDYENNNLRNNIKELETQIQTTLKFLEEKKKENETIQIHKKNLDEEQQIFVGQLVKKGLEEKHMQGEIANLRKEILGSEQQVQSFQEEENKWVEEIKFLSTIREKMARTAS
mmetsp:Transcript_18194/g.17315  ORF Transcript_18194/g.17315 Transcript_18194/m.17315 type:complete len:165 (-) Transcript_18194:1449-1943(-)